MRVIVAMDWIKHQQRRERGREKRCRHNQERETGYPLRNE